jgi:hypothetical protein
LNKIKYHVSNEGNITYPIYCLQRLNFFTEKTYPQIK